jgi:hypothetical protein
MAAAASSLPVPDSPVSNTAARLGATCFTASNTRCIAVELPIMSPKPERCCSCSRLFDASCFNRASSIARSYRLSPTVVAVDLFALDTSASLARSSHSPQHCRRRGEIHSKKSIPLRLRFEPVRYCC